jgi:Asp-tRNA(Asn)/Glu-tRNA(Gln) amidotransferase A subunit family amidase
MDVSWMTAADLQAALRGRELSAVEVLEAVIERSEAVNPKINALALPLFDRARDAATRADHALARGEDGPLCGIPVTIKDSQWLAGFPCKNGSKTLEDFVPRETCAAVARLEDAGAVVFAKTTCPEFSYLGVTFSEVYGTTANPWDLTRTPGGSSGGAAAVVAAGLGPLSLGGDGGGSIRIPAAFCGLVGFKPSFGVVPREPCFPTWKTLVSYGPMARSVADARLMFEEIAGFHSHDRHSTHAHDDEDGSVVLRGLRLVASEDLGFAPIDEDVRAAYGQLLENLESAGVELIFDDPGLRSSAKTWATTAFADAWVSDREELEHRGEILGQSTRASLEFGAKRPAVRTDRRRGASDPDAGLRGLRPRSRLAAAHRRHRDRAAVGGLGRFPLRCQPGRLPGLRPAHGVRRRRLAGFPTGDRAAGLRYAPPLDRRAAGGGARLAGPLSRSCRTREGRPARRDAHRGRSLGRGLSKRRPSHP